MKKLKISSLTTKEQSANTHIVAVDGLELSLYKPREIVKQMLLQVPGGRGVRITTPYVINEKIIFIIYTHGHVSSSPNIILIAYQSGGAGINPALSKVSQLITGQNNVEITQDGENVVIDIWSTIYTSFIVKKMSARFEYPLSDFSLTEF